MDRVRPQAFASLAGVGPHKQEVVAALVGVETWTSGEDPGERLASLVEHVGGIPQSSGCQQGQQNQHDADDGLESRGQGGEADQPQSVDPQDEPADGQRGQQNRADPQDEGLGQRAQQRPAQGEEHQGAQQQGEPAADGDGQADAADPPRTCRNLGRAGNQQRQQGQDDRPAAAVAHRGAARFAQRIVGDAELVVGDSRCGHDVRSGFAVVGGAGDVLRPLGRFGAQGFSFGVGR